MVLYLPPKGAAIDPARGAFVLIDLYARARGCTQHAGGQRATYTSELARPGVCLGQRTYMKRWGLRNASPGRHQIDFRFRVKLPRGTLACVEFPFGRDPFL